MALVFIHPPWFTDTWIPDQGALLPNPTSCTPFSTSAGLSGGHTQIELCQALVWWPSPSRGAVETRGLPLLLGGNKEQVHLRELSCLLGAQLGVPEYQAQLYSNISTKSHFDSNINDSRCHVVLLSLLPLFISSDNWAVTLHVLK